MADARHIGDGVVLPGEPFAGLPAMLLRPGLEVAGGPREIVEDHIRHHQREIAVAQHRDLAIAVDREVGCLLLHTVLEIDGAKRERQAAERQEEHRLVARARGEAAVQDERAAVMVVYFSMSNGGRLSSGAISGPENARPRRGSGTIGRLKRV
jgi:hypothetical protein